MISNLSCTNHRDEISVIRINDGPLFYKNMSGKTDLRIQLKKIRERLSSKQRHSKSRLIQKHLFKWLTEIYQKNSQENHSFQTYISAFWPMPYEPNLLPLLSRLSTSIDFKILLPVVIDKSQPLRFRHWNPRTSMEINDLGIYEPTEGEFLTPKILFIPTLGYTMQGYRLGYGGGYYDRTLSDFTVRGINFVSVGIAWDSCFLKKYEEMEDHDIKLHRVATPDGCFSTQRNCSVF